MISLPLTKYVLMAALRDRVVLSVLLLIAIGASLSVLLGSAAVIETDQFALVFASGGLRIAGAIGVILFVVFHMRRSFDSKDVDYLLTRPISRISFILSHAAAFSLIGTVIALVTGLAVIGMGPHMIGGGHALWVFSLVVEFIIIANAALFFSMVLTSAAPAAMACLGFYVLARMMGQLLGIADQGAEIQVFELLFYVMEIISLIIPRLDLLAQTSWLVYGEADIGFVFVALQGVLYTALLILAAMVDLVRRQF